MLDIQKIITEIESFSNNFLTESLLKFTPIRIIPDNYYHYYTSGNITSKAINCHKNDRTEINVLKWFDDLWLYMELIFVVSVDKEMKPFFTLSVFEGDISDNIKTQLFRAEWDNYENNYHPQPHWHFYSNSINESIINDFSDLFSQEQSEFLTLISEEKSHKLNLNRMHFAMGALWSNNVEGDINKIYRDEDLINWFKGLLTHIKTQLEYAK